jgi:hypothetical protein
MSQSNTKYNLVIARLKIQEVDIRDFSQHIVYFKTILQDVYEDDYDQIISEIKLCMGDLVEREDIAEFFKIMEEKTITNDFLQIKDPT